MIQRFTGQKLVMLGMISKPVEPGYDWVSPCSHACTLHFIPVSEAMTVSPEKEKRLILCDPSAPNICKSPDLSTETTASTLLGSRNNPGQAWKEALGQSQQQKGTGRKILPYSHVQGPIDHGCWLWAKQKRHQQFLSSCDYFQSFGFPWDSGHILVSL